MEFVGEAVRDHITVAGKGTDCVALDIAPWGATSNKLALDGTDVSNEDLWDIGSFENSEKIKRLSKKEK